MICTKATTNLVHTCALIARHGKPNTDAYGGVSYTIKLVEKFASFDTVVYNSFATSGALIIAKSSESDAEVVYSAADSLPLGLVSQVKMTLEA